MNRTPTRQDGTSPAPVHIDLRGVPSLCALARQLVREGANPEALLYAWRGGTLCFTPLPLRHWAGLTTEERADRSIRLVRYRATDAPQGDGYAPQAGGSPVCDAATPERPAAGAGTDEGTMP